MAGILDDLSDQRGMRGVVFQRRNPLSHLSVSLVSPGKEPACRALETARSDVRIGMDSNRTFNNR